MNYSSRANLEIIVWCFAATQCDEAKAFSTCPGQFVDNGFVLFLEQDDVPATNNDTERAIGRWRIRSHSMRGFKTWAGLVNAFTLCNAKIV